MNLLSYITSLEIIKVNSSLNGEIKVIESFGKRTLYANNLEQSGGTITGMWGKAIKTMQQCNNGTIKQCLVLGLGGGTLIEILKKYYPEIYIDILEYDQVMIDIAKNYFGILPSKQLKIINADAFSWVRNNKNKFDLIIMDIYVGKYNPPKGQSENFLKDLKGMLTYRGIILFNRHYQEDEAEYQKFLEKCQKNFSEAKLILSYPFSRILQLR